MKKQAFIFFSTIILLVLIPNAASYQGTQPYVYADSITAGTTIAYAIKKSAPAINWYDKSWNSAGYVKLEEKGRIVVNVLGIFDYNGVVQPHVNVTFFDANGAKNTTIQNDTIMSTGSNMNIVTYPSDIGFIASINWTHWNSSLITTFGANLTRFEEKNEKIYIDIKNTPTGYMEGHYIFQAKTGICELVNVTVNFGTEYTIWLEIETIGIPGYPIMPLLIVCSLSIISLVVLSLRKWKFKI